MDKHKHKELISDIYDCDSCTCFLFPLRTACYLLSVPHKSGTIYAGKKLHHLTSKSQDERSDCSIFRNYDSSQAFVEHDQTLGK